MTTGSGGSRAEQHPRGRTGAAARLTRLLHSAQAAASHRCCSNGFCAGEVPLESELLLPHSACVMYLDAAIHLVFGVSTAAACQEG